MAREEIRKMLEDSKRELVVDYENFTKSIRDELTSFKKKTLDRI